MTQNSVSVTVNIDALPEKVFAVLCDEWQVTELEVQRNFTWTTRSPGLRMTAGHSIEPTGAGCRVVLSFELSGFIAPLVSRLYGGLIERYITTESQGLKKRSESAATSATGAGAIDRGNR